jgi:hypothetical protein
MTEQPPIGNMLIEKLEIYKQQHNHGDMPMDPANFYVNGCIAIVRQHQLGDTLNAAPDAPNNPALGKIMDAYDNLGQQRETSVVSPDVWTAIYTAIFRYYETLMMPVPMLPHDEIMKALRPYIRSPKPVSVSLEKCEDARVKRMEETKMNRFMTAKEWRKLGLSAAFDVAGVKYHDD